MYDYSGLPSLKCEPDLTTAIDAMSNPPMDRRSWQRAIVIADEWRQKEAAMWGVVDLLGKAAVEKITPEYIIVTARTKKFRDGTWVPLRKERGYTAQIWKGE